MVMKNTLSESIQSIEQLIHTFYELNSGYAGQPHDWQKLRDLFIPGTTLIPHAIIRDSAPVAEVDLNAYIERVTRFFSQNDFFEKGIIHHVEVFGSIASVISTYESRHAPDEPTPFKRGMNYIHLMHDGSRWRFAGMVWMDESPENLLPEKYR